MTRRTGGSFGDLPGMFLLVLFRYLSVILKCLCLVSLNCVFGLHMGKLGLHCATSQMLANSVSFFFFGGVGGWGPGKRKVTKVQKGEAARLFLDHLNHYLNWVIYLFF